MNGASKRIMLTSIFKTLMVVLGRGKNWEELPLLDFHNRTKILAPFTIALETRNLKPSLPRPSIFLIDTTNETDLDLLVIWLGSEPSSSHRKKICWIKTPWSTVDNRLPISPSLSLCSKFANNFNPRRCCCTRLMPLRIYFYVYPPTI